MKGLMSKKLTTPSWLVSPSVKPVASVIVSTTLPLVYLHVRVKTGWRSQNGNVGKIAHHLIGLDQHDCISALRNVAR